MIESKLLRTVSLLTLLLTAVICAGLFYLPRLHTAPPRRTTTPLTSFLNHKVELANMNQTLTPEFVEEEKNKARGQLTFKMPEGITGAEIKVSEDYLYQTIMLEIPGADEDYFNNLPLSGSSHNIEEIEVNYEDGVCYIDIATSALFEVSYSYDENDFCVSLVDPHEIYDYVVVIDAGHGGRVPGTVCQGVSEKNIDLAIVQKIKRIFDESEENVGVYYTRLDDSNPEFFYRANLATASKADAFVSIHNNSLAGRGKYTTKGTQVLYDEEDATDRSKELAKILLDNVVDCSGASNRGLVKGNDIYVVRTPDAPAALIEVGFMTNQEELRLLLDEDYQTKVAQGIYNGIMEWLKR